MYVFFARIPVFSEAAPPEPLGYVLSLRTLDGYVLQHAFVGFN